MKTKLRPVTETRRSRAEWNWKVAAPVWRRQQLIQIGVYPPELESTTVKKWIEEEWAELPEAIKHKLHLRDERISKETEALLR
ncbi:unnamed protein product [marine sediment metagenome]|uniref:Uncharacterized protein n=1 Tax=marine sediment metagenome TaxID=412755 RepID=X1FD97_9ZZZZ